MTVSICKYIMVHQSLELMNWTIGLVTGWWFGTWLLFFHILGIIILVDYIIFFRGVKTTNQYKICGAAPVARWESARQALESRPELWERLVQDDLGPEGTEGWGNSWLIDMVMDMVFPSDISSIFIQNQENICLENMAAPCMEATAHSVQSLTHILWPLSVAMLNFRRSILTSQSLWFVANTREETWWDPNRHGMMGFGLPIDEASIKSFTTMAIK